MRASKTHIHIHKQTHTPKKGLYYKALEGSAIHIHTYTHVQTYIHTCKPKKGLYYIELEGYVTHTYTHTQVGALTQERTLL